MLLSETGVCAICEYPFENDYERIEHPLYKDTSICQRCYNSCYKDCDNNIYKERSRRIYKKNSRVKIINKNGVIRIKII